MKPLNLIAAILTVAALIGLVSFCAVPIEKPVTLVAPDDGPYSHFEQPHHDAEDDGMPDMLYGAPRSGHWPTVRKHFLENHGKCLVCGTTENLNVHHIRSFKDRPDLELEMTNLATLCRAHHFEYGHDPDGVDGPKPPNWKFSNPYLMRDLEKFQRNPK